MNPRLADCRCGHALVACHGGGHGAMRSFSLLMTHFQHKASSRPGARSPASPPSWLWSLELWTMMKFMVDKKLWSQPDMQAMFGLVLFYIVVHYYMEKALQQKLKGNQGLILLKRLHLMNLFLIANFCIPFWHFRWICIFFIVKGAIAPLAPLENLSVPLIIHWQWIIFFTLSIKNPNSH